MDDAMEAENVSTQDEEEPMTEVHISRRVLDRMKHGAVLYLESETGEALVGLMQPPSGKENFPTMVVLETIQPRTAVREWAMFSMGDDWEEAIFNWLNENWEVYRSLRRRSYGQAAAVRWDLPLMHLGDWHKQPGMVIPSRADLRTAKDFLKENNQDFLLAPIVTLAEEAEDAPVEANTLIFEDVTPAVRIDFWGFRKGDSGFIPLKPVPATDSSLPRLPEIVWWLDNSERLDIELAALEKDGVNIMDVAQFNADGMPPVETCFALYRPGSYQVILAITPHTYPKKSPSWRLAPIARPEEGKGLFEALFEASKPVEAALVAEWSGDIHALIDGVRMIEKGLEKP